MVRLREQYKKLARPQTVVSLFVVAVMIGGWFWSPQIIRPSRAADVPIITPLAQHVQSVTFNVPVDCSKVPCLALTFDDGPSPAITPQVLDILDKHNVKVTFFLIGLHVADNPALVREIHVRGHEIGNHSWSHRKFSELSPNQIEKDIAKAQYAITSAGAPAPRLFRAPYGDVNAMVRSHVSMTVVSWNVDPEDWRDRKADKVVEHVLSTAKPGAIIDLHDIYQSTADALDPMLTELEKTYQLVTVSELLSLPSGQPGIFYGR